VISFRLIWNLIGDSKSLYQRL